MVRECISRWSDAHRPSRGPKLHATARATSRGLGARGGPRDRLDRAAQGAPRLSSPRDGDESDLGWWSVLDLGRSDYLIARSGPFAGLGLIAIPHDCYAIVRDRAVRDSIHAGPTREHRSRLPPVRGLLPGQPRRARGRRRRALRARRDGASSRARPTRSSTTARSSSSSGATSAASIWRTTTAAASIPSAPTRAAPSPPEASAASRPGRKSSGSSTARPRSALLLGLLRGLRGPGPARRSGARRAARGRRGPSSGRPRRPRSGLVPALSPVAVSA